MSGSIEVITGPMYAGKSAALYDRCQELQDEGQNVLCFRPMYDTKNAGICSRIRPSISATPLDEITSIPDYIKADAMIFDETHMYDKPKQQAEKLDSLRQLGKLVVVGCIDYSYTGETSPFYDAIKEVQPDSLQKLTAFCTHLGCSDGATRTGLFIDGEQQFSGNTLVVDDDQKVQYLPYCLDHFTE